MDISALECPIAHNAPRESAHEKSHDLTMEMEILAQAPNDIKTLSLKDTSERQKVIQIFPVPFISRGGCYVFIDPFSIRRPTSTSLAFARNITVPRLNLIIDIHLFYHIAHLHI